MKLLAKAVLSLWFLWVTLGFVFLLSMDSKAATTTSSKNSLGAVIYQENPMSYRVGSALTVAYVEGGKGMVLRIQPAGTYNLFTEDLLFCGSEADKFIGKTNPVALTYRTRASRLVSGLGCHELVRVDSLKDDKHELP